MQRTSFHRRRRNRKIESGRRGGIRSQEVQRERRMEIHRGIPIYPVIPRWSIGIRDNWSGEDGWFTFVSFRDLIRRIGIVMRGMSVTIRGGVK